MNNTYEKEVIRSVVEDEAYIKESTVAMDIVLEALQRIANELARERERKVVNQLIYRRKSVDSIHKKLTKKKASFDKEGIFRCNDLLGVRMVCLFVDDVYEVAARLRTVEGIRILKEKDYIKKPKNNGYMSLHLLVEAKGRKVEVQLRTLAMDFWSVLDHQLVYKKEFPGAESVGRELKAYAKAIARMDQNMLRLRNKIDCLECGKTDEGIVKKIIL